MLRSAAGLFLSACAASAALPPPGTFEVEQQKYTDSGLEPGSGQTTRDFVVTWPVNATSAPLVLFAHGFLGGGPLTGIYSRHFKDLAAYGYVVVAPTSCALSCGSPLKGGWEMFVHEVLRGRAFAENATADPSKPWGRVVDFSRGVGFAGHSMGGVSCVLASNATNAAKYGIKATVVEHGYGTGVDGADITVPVLAFTGTADVVVFPSNTKKIYSKAPKPKSFRNQKGKGHLEMTNILDYNPEVAAHTAAFFKVWLEADKGAFYQQIYGSGDDSFCGYAEMKECESYPSP